MKKPLSINQKIGWRLIGNEIVSFNCNNQLVVIWNEVASRLWEKISEGTNFEQLICWLSNEFSISKRVARQDTLVFLREASSMDMIDFQGGRLKKEKLLTRSESKENDGENVLLEIEMMAIKNLVPFAITFEMTYACNEHCIHCYMDKNLPHIGLVDIKRVLGEIAEEGCLFVSLTGGEFFARKDALKIVEYASKLNFIIDILSNGTLINKEIAEILAKNSVRRVQVSLYGATSEIHDSITRLNGSFQKTIRGIELLKKAGVKVEIAFPLMRQNFHERYAVKRLAKLMGCVISPSHIITARNDGSKDTYSLRITDEQLKKFLSDKELSSLYSGRKPFEGHQFYFGFSDLLKAAPCYSGFNTCAITPSGKVFPCNQLLYDVGDLANNSFSEIWRNSSRLQYLRNLKIHDLKECADCKLLASCTRCPGLALLENGSLLASSLEHCRISKINNQIQIERGENYEEKKSVYRA